MGLDLPPNLADTAATVISRAPDGKSNPNSQANKRKEDEARDAGNASIARKNEPGNK